MQENAGSAQLMAIFVCNCELGINTYIGLQAWSAVVGILPDVLAIILLNRQFLAFLLGYIMCHYSLSLILWYRNARPMFDRSMFVLWSFGRGRSHTINKWSVGLSFRTFWSYNERSCNVQSKNANDRFWVGTPLVFNSPGGGVPLGRSRWNFQWMSMDGQGT